MVLYGCMTAYTSALPQAYWNSNYVASIVNTSQPKISMEFVDVQKQFESSDCGVTICYSPLTGSGSGNLVFSQSEMRIHLFKMLKEKKFFQC